MIRLLHLADLHLGWEPKYLADEKRKLRKNERDQLIKKAVDFALDRDNKIDGMLVAGDLFEKFNPDDTLIREVLRQLGRVTAQGLVLITVPGNHDEITYKESVYRKYSKEWPGILITNPMPEHCETLTISGVKTYIYSLAYTGGLTKPQNIDTFPRLDEEGFHIGMYHGSLDWEGLGDRSLPLSSSKLLTARYDYIALGHYHQFMMKKIGNGLAVYPGAVEFKSFSDPGTGQFTVCSWDGNKANVEKVAVDIRQSATINIDISLVPDYESLIMICHKYADSEKIVQISLTGTPKFHVDAEKLKDELEHKFFYIDMNENVQYFSNEFLDRIASEPTIRGMFVKRIQRNLVNVQDEHERSVLEQAMLKGLSALEGGKR